MIDNIALYRTFLTALRTGSLSQAARELYITQPAVSGAISQLEDALGVKLFFRTNRGITPTPEGELLGDYVGRAMTLLEEGEDKLRDVAGLRSGVLRVGASDMTLKFYLLDRLSAFNTAYPGVRISVTNNPTPRSLEALKAGKLDLCVVSDPVAPDPELSFRPVRRIRDIAVASPAIVRRLSPDGAPVSFDALADETVLLLEKNCSTRAYMERHFVRCHAPDSLLRPAFALAESDLLLEFAERGLGISFLVEDFALRAIEEGRVLPLPLRDPFPPRSFLLATLKKVPLSTAARRFLEQLKDDGAKKTKDPE